MLTDLPEAGADDRLRHELEFLYGRINYERTTEVTYPRHFKLESMRRLLGELGNPQRACDIIHVAGTKGKGSVCQMIAGALNESGILAGIYSSPHIETIRERISVAGQLISRDRLAAVLQQTRQAVQRLDEIAEREGFRKNSFFEVITATSLLHFQQCGVSRVLLEVGMGGRLDSTNVCEPALCVITNISLDHTRQLGATVDLIAREKAGIIKPGIPVVSGVTDPLAAREIREASAVCNAPLIEAGVDFQSEVVSIDGAASRILFHTGGQLPTGEPWRMESVALHSPGRHQVENAAVAIAALHVLRQQLPQISDTAIRQSLRRFQIIGRGEVLCDRPRVIVDMAHNVASIGALMETLPRLGRGQQQGSSPEAAGTRVLIFSSSRDKDLPGMIRQLLPGFDQVIFTRFVENPRAADPGLLLRTAREILPAGGPGLRLAANPAEAWDMVRDHLTPRDLLCVAGSAFLVAELRPVLNRWLAGRRPARSLVVD